MDPLKILRLKPGSSLEEAKKSYRILSRENHPDKNPTFIIETFQAIQEAYQALVNNPGLLNQKKAHVTTFEGYIRTSMVVTLEDFYYARERSMKISRSVHCRRCGGTGSKYGPKGTCEHCDGKGKIKSNVMLLLNRDPECAYCKGTGVRNAERCQTCGGTRYMLEETEIRFRLTLALYYQKMAVVKGEGNQRDPDTYGDVYVKLFIKPEEDIFIEETHFVTYDKILPIQRILGDRAILTLFDREIIYNIRPGASETFVEDHIRGTFKREVRIKFRLVLPKLTPETEKFYREILSVEKKQLKG